MFEFVVNDFHSFLPPSPSCNSMLRRKFDVERATARARRRLHGAIRAAKTQRRVIFHRNVQQH